MADTDATVRTTADLLLALANIPTAAPRTTNRRLLRDMLVSLSLYPTLTGETGVVSERYAYGDIRRFGGDMSLTDNSTAINNATTTLTALGAMVLDFPAGTFKVAASFAMPANIIFRGQGKSSTIIKRMHSGDMVSSIGPNAGLRDIRFDGNGASFPTTGRGIVWTTAVGAQTMINAEVINFPLACLDFSVADAGSEFRSIGSTYYTLGAVGTVGAVKVSGTDTQAIPRHFYATGSSGCTLFDFGGCNDFFASGFYTNGFIFNTASSKVTLTNFRCGAAAGRQTIKGSSHQISGIFAVAVTLDSSTASVDLGGSEVLGYDISDAGVNNKFTATFDYGSGSPSFFTAAWTSDGTAPALGNGTLTGIVTRTGRKVRVNIRFVIGSTSTLGSGQYFFNLPYLDYSNYRFLGECWVQKTGTLVISTGTARVVPGQQKLSCYFNGSSTPLSAAQPVAWATGDEMNITLDYTAR